MDPFKDKLFYDTHTQHAVPWIIVSPSVSIWAKGGQLWDWDLRLILDTNHNDKNSVWDGSAFSCQIIFSQIILKRKPEENLLSNVLGETHEEGEGE